MVKKLHLIFLLITGLSYGQEYNFKAADANARKLLNSNPAAAKAIIKKTLAQEDLHDTIYGNTYNLYGIYYGMTGKPDSTIFYTKKAITYLNDYPKIKVKSLMNLAIGYRNKGEYTTSIKLLKEAATIQKKQKNNLGLAIAYGELATNYNYTTDYENSLSYLTKAIELLKNTNHKKELIVIKQKLAGTYIAKENFAFAIDLYKECAAFFKETGAKHNYYLTEINLGEAFTHVKKYTEARNALETARKGLQELGDEENLGVTAFRMAGLESEIGNISKATLEFEKALTLLKESGSKRIINMGGTYINFLNKHNKAKEALRVITLIEATKKFKNAGNQEQLTYQNAIAETYKATNNDKEAIKAYQNTIIIMDSIASAKKRVAIEEIQAKFQTELQREKNLALETNNRILQKQMQAEKTTMVFYIVISIALILLILLFLRGYWLRNRLQQEELKTIETEKNLIEQQHKHEQELTYSQKNIIDEKQRELTSTALRMANYQDNISEIIAKCNSNASLSVNDIKKELQLLMKQKDYWKQFETRFNTLHPEFGNQLTAKFPKLTKNDIEFCSLLKLNLSNKEIASLLQISHESAITKKYRIKKKMEINDDAEFEKLLMEI
ncbi:tetratricopeptide repeat protein [Flavobacterium suzhouense]|uniref:Tetratricopeptide repeat protein n=1 Tax=Flavobacterium suzhouense TaxID=1529638 RepID=A0ABW5NTY4_9FLAO